MPLIKLTQEAIDRGKLPEAGWSPAKLNDVTEFPAANKESVNWLFEFNCTGGPERKDDNSGRFQNVLFNAKALGIGDGNKGIPQAIELFQRMIAALLGIHFNEVTPDSYDTDVLKGKHCWIKIQPQADAAGKLSLTIVDFSADQDLPF